MYDDIDVVDNDVDNAVSRSRADAAKHVCWRHLSVLSDSGSNVSTHSSTNKHLAAPERHA